MDCIEETDGENADADADDDAVAEAVAADSAAGNELEESELESVTVLLSNKIDKRFLLLEEYAPVIRTSSNACESIFKRVTNM